MKYHIITLGCQMNKSDNERITQLLDQNGFTYTENEEEASLLGILACSVRQKAIDKVYSKISRWNKKKNNRNLITFLSGCILPADKEKFLKLFDIVIQTAEIQKLPGIIARYGIVTPVSHQQTFDGIDIYDFWNVKPKYTSSFEAYVPIQNGCDKFCTFCAVPYTRGREVSRPSDEILREVENLVESGYKSITLLGQNVNSYGLDKGGAEITFTELLKRIGEYGLKCGKEFLIYFTSPHPRDMTRDVIEVISKYQCLAKQVHLPVQSGDDRILIKMNRNHNISKYRKIVEDIRELIPQATLFTDIIVGFPGEEDDHFANTMGIMDEFKYNMAFIAVYSPRPGAVSSRWDDVIPMDIKKKRLHSLTDMLKKHTHDYNNDMIGKTYRVLTYGKDSKTGYMQGFTEGRINVRFKHDDNIQPGEFTDVLITSSTPFAIEGREVIKNQIVMEEYND